MRQLSALNCSLIFQLGGISPFGGKSTQIPLVAGGSETFKNKGDSGNKLTDTKPGLSYGFKKQAGNKDAKEKCT